MKKTGIFLVLLLMVTGFVVSTGCTSSNSPDGAPSVTPAITPSESQQTVNTTMKPAAPSATATKVIPLTKKTATPAPAPRPDPVDVSDIRFVRYTDNDFSLDYPSTWNVSESTYTSYPCFGTATKRCYQNEIRTTGPFDFSDDERLQKPSRIVTFTSADKKQKVVAFTADFLDHRTGKYVLNPTFERCADLVTANYPDVSGAVVGDYTFMQSGNTMSSGYTVIMPKTSAAYPLAYTMKNFVTLHHNYRFAYIADNAMIEKYRNLRDRILSSITLNDLA